MKIFLKLNKRRSKVSSTLKVKLSIKLKGKQKIPSKLKILLKLKNMKTARMPATFAQTSHQRSAITRNMRDLFMTEANMTVTLAQTKKEQNEETQQ